MSKHKVFWFYLLGLWSIPVSTLKITSVDVPKNIWESMVPVKFNCKYDLVRDETLYAVKWYKDDTEFFRCMADGSVQIFALRDISVHHNGRSQIGSCSFELSSLWPESGGNYKCEVSLEWPTFETLSESAHVQYIRPRRVVQPKVTTAEVDILPAVMENRGSLHVSSGISISILTVVIYTF